MWVSLESPWEYSRKDRLDELWMQGLNILCKPSSSCQMKTETEFEALRTCLQHYRWHSKAALKSLPWSQPFVGLDARTDRQDWQMQTRTNPAQISFMLRLEFTMYFVMLVVGNVNHVQEWPSPFAMSVNHYTLKKFLCTARPEAPRVSCSRNESQYHRIHQLRGCVAQLYCYFSVWAGNLGVSEF